MNLSFATPTALEYFAALVASDEQFPLLEAAVSIAQDEYPELDVQEVLGDLDHMLARIKRRIPADADGLHRLRLLNQFFYRELGFGGNVNDYYDPDNSYLNTVLRTRRGIPITLGVIWLELAQGLGLRARGVAFPGHFMVKVNLPKGQVVMDPFTGHSLSREELVDRLGPYLGDTATHEDYEVPLGLYLQAATARDTIARMLRNLKEIHKTQEDWPRLLAVQERLVALLPAVWAEWRDRGLVLATLGRPRPAAADLQVYLDNAGEVPDRGAIAARLKTLMREAG